MEKIKELIELIEFEYGDCNCDYEKKCSYCKVMDELKEWKEAARSEADEVNRLQAENKKLREALEFYANQTSWMGYHRNVDIIAPSDCEPAKALSDDFDILLGGKRAREALKEVSEK